LGEQASLFFIICSLSDESLINIACFAIIPYKKKIRAIMHESDRWSIRKKLKAIEILSACKKLAVERSDGPNEWLTDRE